MNSLAKSFAALILAAGVVAPSPSFAAFKSDPPQEKAWMLQDEKNTIDVFNHAADSVVYVETHRMMREDFFSPETHDVPVGAGSGFIWDQQGYIVTNAHVIASADPKNGVNVRLRDGRMLPAKIIGADPRKDVALLKISDAKNLPTGFSSNIADSGELQVGQKTIAIGNPFELSHTLTTGVISAVQRTVPSPVEGFSSHDMIQTDAAINPGNSGGPLMDSRGQLIGMNSMIYSQSGTSAGVGFAVPSNTIKRIVSQLIKNGKITYAALGIESLPPQYNQYMKNIKGVIIFRVHKETGAAKAGLRGLKQTRDGEVEFGDVITAVDGKKVEVIDDIRTALDEKNAGDTVKVDFLRKGKKDSAEVKLTNISE